MIPVQLTPVTSQLPTQPSLPPIFQTSQVSSNASNVPNAIAVLPSGSILQGFVLNRDPNGNPVLRTAYGDFLLKSALFLKIGVDVTVKIESSGKNFRAAITAVDGTPVETLSRAEGDVETTDPVESSVNRPVQTPVREQPSLPILRGVVLNPSPEAEQLPLIKTGTALKLQIIATGFPGQVTEDVLQAVEESFNPAKPQSVPTEPRSLPQALQQQMDTSFTPAPRAAYPAQVIAGLKGNIATVSEERPLTLPGLVIGQERDGEPVISTPLGLVKITSHVTLPTGTQVTLKLSQVTPAGIQETAAEEMAADTPLALARNWQSLQTLVDMLGADPDFEALLANSGLTRLQTNMPVPDQAAKLGTGMLFFISALKGGDVRDWLGARLTSRLEERGLESVLKKVAAEFSGLQKLAGETTQNGWQTTFMPVMVDAQVQMVRMYTKRNRKREQENEGENTRFVVEMELSQLGEMQLDGLVRKTEKPYVDLILRAHRPLPNDSQSDILNIFQLALTNGGFDGALHFQWMNAFPVHPLDEAVPQPPDIVA